MVVCTLCSCYPWPVLGLPPVWYKSAPYRAKAVMDPRGVLADFGVTLPAGTEANVSTRIKMGQTSNVTALVKADNKFYFANKEVKVTLGGCGG
jgi:predicted secreted protein